MEAYWHDYQNLVRVYIFTDSVIAYIDLYNLVYPTIMIRVKFKLLFFTSNRNLSFQKQVK